MKLLKTWIISLLNITIFISFISVLYYYNIINTNLYNVLKIISLIIIFILNGYKTEKNSKKKIKTNAYICFIISLLLILINIIFSKITFKLTIYIIILIISNIFGGIIYRKKRNT